MEDNLTLQLVVALQGFITLGIAGLAAYTGHLQWNTSRNTLRLALFEKRIVIFEAVRRFLKSIGYTGMVDPAELALYMQASKEVRWIFDEATHNYLQSEVYDPAISLQTLITELQGMPAGPGRAENAQQQRALKEKLSSVLDALDQTFARHLQLAD